VAAVQRRVDGRLFTRVSRRSQAVFEGSTA